MTPPAGDRKIQEYLDQLASSAPTPGGGSVAGVVAALAMALGRMVISLSDESPELANANARLIEATSSAMAASDDDERAYGGYIAATKLPKSSPEDKTFRTHAMQTALHAAAETPLRLAELVSAMKPTLRQVAEQGNPHVVSDAAIALVLADAAIQACLINVRVNLPYLKVASIVSAFETRITAITK